MKNSEALHHLLAFCGRNTGEIHYRPTLQLNLVRAGALAVSLRTAIYLVTAYLVFAFAYIWWRVRARFESLPSVAKRFLLRLPERRDESNSFAAWKYPAVNLPAITTVSPSRRRGATMMLDRYLVMHSTS
jgi:hypothetical protein